MNISEMSKEQKQWIGLGAIVGVFVLYAAVNFGIAPLMTSWSASKSELTELTEKLDKADHAVKQEAKIKKDMTDITARLQAAADVHIPDTHNTLSWVTRRIYAHARDLRLDLESVSPFSASGGSIVTKDKEGNPDRSFDIYTVRIATTASYVELLKFIDVLEQSNEYLTISGVSITVARKDPERHMLSINVQWPIWTSPTGRGEIRRLEDQSHG